MFVRLAEDLFISRTNIPLRCFAFAARRCPPCVFSQQIKRIGYHASRLYFTTVIRPVPVNVSVAARATRR